MSEEWMIMHLAFHISFVLQ